jgi:glycosyltransferase involved in cell wall biosynthesis
MNERETLAGTLSALPRQIDGIDGIETLVIDDGSTDGTADVAKRCGVDHIVRLPRHRGLARAFAVGLDASLHLGADIVVNTDADGQYPGNDIPKLVAPILRGEADIVIGDRGVSSVPHFPAIKRWLQELGSCAVSKLSGIEIGDVTSGFRAYSREAALRMNILSDFSYTLETIIQSGKKPITVVTVSTTSNPPTRPSRLFAGTAQYLRRQIPTVLRLYLLYQPLKTFVLGSLVLLGPGVLIGMRFLYFWVRGAGAGHIQSLILAAILSIVGFQVLILGFVADLLAANRRLLEDTLYQVRKIELWNPSARHRDEG